jgi:hypothetical protein
MSELTINNNNDELQPAPAAVYYACNDPANPPCRQFVNQGNCRRRLKCRFYHPPIITTIIKRKTTRELGHCYCGAHQRRLMSKRAFTIRDGERYPVFFAVCGRTGRSMKQCM